MGVSLVRSEEEDSSAFLTACAFSPSYFPRDPCEHKGGAPRAITLDNGSESASRIMDAWAYRHGIQLDFIRPGKPVENSLIGSFNGRLRD